METLVTVALIKDGEQLALKYENGDPNQPITAAIIEELIRALTLMRTKMHPPVRQSDPQFGDKHAVTLDPRWYMEPDTFIGGAKLLIRDPGLGWLGFALPQQSLRALYAQIERTLSIVEQQDRLSLPN